MVAKDHNKKEIRRDSKTGFEKFEDYFDSDSDNTTLQGKFWMQGSMNPGYFCSIKKILKDVSQINIINLCLFYRYDGRRYKRYSGR